MIVTRLFLYYISKFTDQVLPKRAVFLYTLYLTQMGYFL